MTSRVVLPLEGVRVAVTRPTGSAAALADCLREAGAVPLLMPLIRITPPTDDAAIRDAISRVADYDWIVFTSAAAVHVVAALLPQHAIRSAAVRIAAVGASTAVAAESALGVKVDVVPNEYTGAALADAMVRAAPIEGAAVLWPRAEVAHDALSRTLTGRGARLDAPIAYRTECDSATARELGGLVAQGVVDVLTFTSPSAVRCYSDAGGGSGHAVIAVIGGTTAEAARERGMAVHVEPREHTMSALAAELGRHSSGRS